MQFIMNKEGLEDSVVGTLEWHTKEVKPLKEDIVVVATLAW